MDYEFISNTEMNEIKERINREIKRRATFKWWDPLAQPAVGSDKSSPLSIPNSEVLVTDDTYTVNNPSTGSIEETRNVDCPAQGDNPSPVNEFDEPTSSAAKLDMDELKNLLVGLSKIQDINLYYGRDEITTLGHRQTDGIKDALTKAENSKLNKPLHESDISETKNDPNGGLVYKNADQACLYSRTYPIENGQYVMPSGESDGEEANDDGELCETNFYDDHGAPLGDGSYTPYNPYVSPSPDRNWYDHKDEDRSADTKMIDSGGKQSIRFGLNPRNPNEGESYISRPVYGGSKGSCEGACVGLCYQTCDNQCSESCETTCWDRCGNACTSTCGNVCTGCTHMCHHSCSTKCENSTGYSCVSAGSKAVKITADGGSDGNPATNNINASYHSCTGCSYSCQFYPNKKTSCWDNACMGQCFTTCHSYCSTSCFGGCVSNSSENDGSFKDGIGEGCKNGCTINCIGACSGTCESYCVQTCWSACRQQCTDDCNWECSTVCGFGCDQKCTQGCTGCTSCAGSCESVSTERVCVGCGSVGGCTSTCQHDCDYNCKAWGCTAVCGSYNTNNCTGNCRVNCTNTSCTAMCSDACSATCSSCINTCGFNCGACTSNCSTGCTHDCNITCTDVCIHSCSISCLHSCSEECGGCSNLCYSCVGMCIGACSVKCQDGCTSCANNCSWWCDSACNRECMVNCVNRCIQSCSGTCATYISSEANTTIGPDREPTSPGYKYQNPKNREEERDSFKVYNPIDSPSPPELDDSLITIYFDDETRHLLVDCPEEVAYIKYQTSITSGVFDINETTGEITINDAMLDGYPPTNEPNADNGDGMFIVVLVPTGLSIASDDIRYKLLFGFGGMSPIFRDDGTIVCIVIRDVFLYKNGELTSK